MINDIENTITLLSNIKKIVDKYGVDSVIMNSIDPHHELIEAGIFQSYESLENIDFIKENIDKKIKQYEYAKEKLMMNNNSNTYSRSHDVIEFEYHKPFSDEKIITNVEKELNFKFDKIYIKFIKQFNGGRPSHKVFDSVKTKGLHFHKFLPFYPKGSDDIISINRHITNPDKHLYPGMEDIVAFGIDTFGNLICFEKNNDNVVWFDHETNQIELVAKGFTEFLNKLRKK